MTNNHNDTEAQKKSYPRHLFLEISKKYIRAIAYKNYKNYKNYKSYTNYHIYHIYPIYHIYHI
jgi:hypothetical protein